MKRTLVQATWARVEEQRTQVRIVGAADDAERDAGHAAAFPRLPLVLLHGLGCSSAAWTPSLREFAARGLAQPVLAPDFPGCGRSGYRGGALSMTEMADWTVRLLDHYDIPQAYFAGNSMGCQVALALARRHPERTGALALLGPTTGHSQVSFGRYALGLLLDGFSESLSYNLLLLRMYAQMGLGRYLKTVRYLMDEDPLAKITEVRCPVLVLRGGHDRIITEDMARGLASALPRGEYQALDSTAHAAEYNTPDLFVGATLEFLRRVEAEAQRAAVKV